MKTISVSEMQHHIGAILDRVAAGETLTIARHNVPLAQIIPFPAQPQPTARHKHPDWMAQLKEIYGDKVLPDSQPILDEMREDRF